MVISDYEYFSIPKFLDTGFYHPDMKALGAAPSKNRRGSLVLYEEVRGTLLFIQYSESLHLVTHSVIVKVDKNHQKFGYFSFLFVISLL